MLAKFGMEHYRHTAPVHTLNYNILGATANALNDRVMHVYNASIINCKVGQALCHLAMPTETATGHFRVICN